MCSVGSSKVGRYYILISKSEVPVVKAPFPAPCHLFLLPPSFPLLPPLLCFLPAEQWHFWGLPCVFSYKACPYGCVSWILENMGGQHHDLISRLTSYIIADRVV